MLEDYMNLNFYLKMVRIFIVKKIVLFEKLSVACFIFVIYIHIHIHAYTLLRNK